MNEYITYLIAWKYFPVVCVLAMLVLAWCITVRYNDYMEAKNAKMMLVAMIMNGGESCNKKMMPDEMMFQQMISLPNRDPRWLTSSMVAPVGVAVPADEKRKESRMEVFNMFYNNGIDDETSFNSRPRNLYVIP